MSNKRLIETVVFGVIEAGPNKPEKPRSEWLGNVKERRNTWIVTEPLVQRRTENCWQQVWEKQWTPTGCSAWIIRTGEVKSPEIEDVEKMS